MKHIAKILVFSLLLALLCVGGTALADGDYYGFWEYDEYYLWIDLEPGSTWSEYGREGCVTAGYFAEDGSTLCLYLPDGTEYGTLEVDGEVMTDSEGDTLFPGSMPAFEDNGLGAAGAAAVWECQDEDLWIQIYEGGAYSAYDSDGFLNVGYARLLDDGTVGLFENSDDDDSDAILTLSISGDTAVDDGGEEYVIGTLPFGSYLTVGAPEDGTAADSAFLGVMGYNDYDLWLEFLADGTWNEYNADGLILSGYCDYEADGVTAHLHLADSTDYRTVYMGTGGMNDDEGDGLFWDELPDFPASALAECGAVGVWEYTGDDMDAWLRIYEGGSFVLYTEDGVSGIGYARVNDDGTVSLYEDRDDEESMLDLTISGDTAEDGAGEEFILSALPYGSSAAASGYDGVWEYTEYDLWLALDEAGGTFTFYDEDGRVLSGTLAGPDTDGSLTLSAKGETVTITLQDDDTLSDWDGDTLFRSELPDL